MTVGATSMSDTRPSTVRPFGTPGPAIISGTRSVVSYTKMLWPISPCSPKASP